MSWVNYNYKRVSVAGTERNQTEPRSKGVPLLHDYSPMCLRFQFRVFIFIYTLERYSRTNTNSSFTYRCHKQRQVYELHFEILIHHRLTALKHV